MDERLSERLIATDEEFESNLALLADPKVIADQQRYREVTGRHAELKPIVDAFRRYRDAETESEEAAELAAIEDDAEMIEYLNGVIAVKQTEMEETEMTLRRLLIPKDPNDDKDVIVEIRSAAGGDEASLWAGDLYRMYERFVERSRWTIEPINVSPSDTGGLKEATFAVKGKGAYSRFKFEAGPHRVQRVPKTESQGRVHTSMATVAVLPEAEAVEVEILDNDLDVETLTSLEQAVQDFRKCSASITHQ